ncbi:MAG: FHA domain-containing protein [Planctomycetaceae bacterium]|nr:FHA domain-containing protein [Planctomycetaceae bacterium]
MVLEPGRHAHWSRYLLTPGEHLIGSAPECSLVVDVPGLAGQHAEFRVGPEGLRLRAIDARTWVNDGPVREALLRAGDRVTIGPCSWTLRPATADDLLEGMPDSDAVETVTETSSPAAAVHIPAASPEADPAASVEPPQVPPEHTADAGSNVSPPAAETTGRPDPLALLDAAEDLLHAAIEDETPRGAVVEPSPTPPVEAGPPPWEVLRLHDELQDLRRQLDSARAAWREETLRREVELAAESTALARRGASVERTEHELERARHDLDAQRQTLSTRAAELQRFEAQLTQLQQNLAHERTRLEEVAAQTRTELEREATRQTAAWAAWEETQQRWLSRLTERDVELEERRAALQADREELQKTRVDLDRARHEFEQSQRALEAEREEWTRERSDWEAQCAARNAAHAESLAQVQRQQEQLSHELHERAHVHAEFLAAQQQLQHERRLFAEQQADWLRERETLWGDLADRRRQLDRETDHLESTRRQIEQLQEALEQEFAAARRQTQAAEEALAAAQSHIPAAAEEPVVSEGDAVETDAAEELSESDLDAVQLALDALAARFEEFAELEQRLSNKHGELLELQQDLAVREAALNTQTEAWRQEHDLWQQEVAQDAARREAWDRTRQSAEDELRSERLRWTDHLLQLGALAAEDATPAAPGEDPPPPVVDASWNRPDATTPFGTIPDDADPRDEDPEPIPSSVFSPLLDWDEAPREARRFSEPVADESLHDVATAVDAPPPTPSLHGFSIDPRDDVEYDSPYASPAPPHELDYQDRAREFIDPLRDFGLVLPPAPADVSAVDGAPDFPADPVDEEPSPIADVPPAGVSLRAELARMFDLPEDFAAREAAAAQREAATACESPIAEDLPDADLTAADAQTAADVADADADADEEEWRSRLASMLAGPPARDVPAAMEDSAPPSPRRLSTPQPDPVAEPATSEIAEEDDSVASYMERLLARTRKGGAESPVPLETRREPDTRSSLAIEPSAVVEEVSEVAPRRETAEPRKPVDKEATRAELQSFRKVANMSARSALAKHTWATMKTEFTVQSTLAGLCTLGSVGYLSAPIWGKAVQWGPGMGCVVGAGFVGYRAWLTLRKLREWSQVLEPEAAQEMETSRHLADEEAAAQSEPASADEPSSPTPAADSNSETPPPVDQPE